MPQENLKFQNNQAQEQKIAGVYEEINSDFLQLLKNDLLNPKPLMVCGGGTSSRCAAEAHWTLDLRKNFRRVEFQELTNVLTIEAGINMQSLLEKAISFNRSFPIGLSGLTGIGYILTGGISPLSRKYGLAIDNILEINGYWGNGEKFKILKPNKSTSKERRLMWKGLCGAAPFLAIITSLKLKTQELKSIYTWETTLSASQLAETILLAENWPNSASLYWIWGEEIKAYGVYELDHEEDFENFQKIIKEIPKNDDFVIYKVANLSKIIKLQPSNINSKYYKRQHSEVLGLLGPEINNKAYLMVKYIEELINKRPLDTCFICSQQLGGMTIKKGTDLTSFIHRNSVWKPWITGSWNAGDVQGREASLKWMEDCWEGLKSFCPGVHLAQIHPHLKWHNREINAAFKMWLPELQGLKSNFDPKGILPPL